MNVHVEPALHPNIRCQIRDAAESAATQVDVIRLCGRAPALARCFVRRVIVRTGVDHLDDHVLCRAAVLIVIVSPFRNRTVRIAFHRHALATVLLHGTRGGRRAIAGAVRALALALAPGPNAAQIPRGTVIARVAGAARGVGGEGDLAFHFRYAGRVRDVSRVREV